MVINMYITITLDSNENNKFTSAEWIFRDTFINA